MRKNVVLTGLPRGGTTLMCHLLNKLPDTVALHEPIPPARFVGLEDEEAVLDEVEKFYGKMRRMIRRRGVAFSKRIKEQVTDHDYRPDLASELRRREASGKTRRKRSEKKVTIEKEVSRRFLLAIKQPGMFSGLLPVLTHRFSCYATIRNPLPVLASWDSYDRSTREGRQPAAERYDEDLERALTSIEDRMDRQLYLLSWFFERFERELPEEHIVRYEEIMSSGGRALSTITPAAQDLDEPLESRNLNPAYDRDNMLRVGERLLASEGAYWHFYSRESVEELLNQVV